jgi:hypothetical protein
MAAVPVHRGGMAGGAVNTMRQLGYAFGVALLGTVFATRATAGIGRLSVPGPARLARGLAGGQAQAILQATPGAARAALGTLCTLPRSRGSRVRSRPAGSPGSWPAC